MTALRRPRWDGADWASLVESGYRRSCPAGHRIIVQGDESSWVAALVSGRVKIVYTGADGEEILIAVRGPGDLLGEFAHADREPRSASVQAMEPCVVSIVPTDRFTAWVNNRDLQARLDRYVVAKTREAASLAWQLTRQRPAQRLATLMLAVIEAAGARHPAPLTIPMSQDELARSIGLARSSITPVLAVWKAQGLVSIERAHTTVLDLAAVRHAAEGDPAIP